MLPTRACVSCVTYSMCSFSGLIKHRNICYLLVRVFSALPILCAVFLASLNIGLYYYVTRVSFDATFCVCLK